MEKAANHAANPQVADFNSTIINTYTLCSSSLRRPGGTAQPHPQHTDPNPTPGAQAPPQGVRLARRQLPPKTPM